MEVLVRRSSEIWGGGEEYSLQCVVIALVPGSPIGDSVRACRSCVERSVVFLRVYFVNFTLKCVY
jgi:hypothetical protein